MSFSVVHLSDPHFGVSGDLDKVGAVAHLVPDLAPDLTVISGDVSLRARHGEFQAAMLWVRDLERTARVYLLPGNHDVQWWRRPLIPFGPAAKYVTYRQHCGPVLAPTMEFAEAIVAGAVTAHGVAWGSLTRRLRDVAVTGHLSRREALRVNGVFAKAQPDQAQVLVMHHNVLPGESSQRLGLARAPTARRRIVDAGVDVVLCGHDPEQHTDVVEGVVVSCAGTLSRRSRDVGPSAFHRVVIDEKSVHVEAYIWESARKLFRRSETLAFPRRHPVRERELAAGAV